MTTRGGKYSERSFLKKQRLNISDGKIILKGQYNISFLKTTLKKEKFFIVKTFLTKKILSYL